MRPPDKRKVAEPGRAGDLRETDQAGKLIGEAENTAPDSFRQELGETSFDHGEPGIYDVYSDFERVGAVAVGRSIRAIRCDGSELGTYGSIADARAALLNHARSARAAT